MVHNPVKEFVPLKEVKVGQEVCIAELNQLATVLALPDKNGDVLVRAGIIKTKVPLKGLKQPDKLIKEPQPKTKAQQRYSRLTGDANRPNGRVERVQRSAKMELNLLGLTVDEALPEVDCLYRSRHSERADSGVSDPWQRYRCSAHCDPQTSARQPDGQKLPSGPLW